MRKIVERHHQRHRVGFLPLDIVAGIDHIESVEHPQDVERHQCGVAALASHDRELDSRRVRIGQQIGDPVEELDQIPMPPLVGCDIAADRVIVMLGLEHISDHVVVRRPKERANLLWRQRLAGDRHEGVVERLVDQRQGVGQRAVEVEDRAS